MRKITLINFVAEDPLLIANGRVERRYAKSSNVFVIKQFAV